MQRIFFFAALACAALSTVLQKRSAKEHKEGRAYKHLLFSGFALLFLSALLLFFAFWTTPQ